MWKLFEHSLTCVLLDAQHLGPLTWLRKPWLPLTILARLWLPLTVVIAQVPSPHPHFVTATDEHDTPWRPCTGFLMMTPATCLIRTQMSQSPWRCRCNPCDVCVVHGLPIVCTWRVRWICVRGYSSHVCTDIARNYDLTRDTSSTEQGLLHESSVWESISWRSQSHQDSKSEQPRIVSASQRSWSGPPILPTPDCGRERYRESCGRSLPWLVLTRWEKHVHSTRKIAMSDAMSDRIPSSTSRIRNHFFS